MTDNALAVAVIPPADQRQVEILGDQVMAVRLEDGSIYVPVRMLCDLLVIDRAAQVRRIKRDDAMAEDLIEVTVETPGGPQAMQVLRVETVPYWLGGVSVKHVRDDLQDKLKAYKRWLVRTVYEAFLRELGSEVEGAASPEIQDLIRQRDWHRAMAAMAEAQLALAQRVETVNARMDRAAQVVGDVQRRLTRLEQQLNPGDVILDEQAAAIQNAVKALGVFLTSQDPSKNHFQAIWTEIGRRFRVPEYRRIRQHQYAEVLAFLEEWLQAALPAPTSRAPGQTLTAPPALPQEGDPR